jgi:hypothetical protein
MFVETKVTVKGTVSRDFFLESVSPKLLIIPLGPLQIFSKIRGDIRSSRFATGVNEGTPVANVKNLQAEKF